MRVSFARHPNLNEGYTNPAEELLIHGLASLADVLLLIQRYGSIHEALLNRILASRIEIRSILGLGAPGLAIPHIDVGPWGAMHPPKIFWHHQFSARKCCELECAFSDSADNEIAFRKRGTRTVSLPCVFSCALSDCRL